MDLSSLRCDGCGQPATAEHLGRRLKRLEEMTKFRPIHVQVLFLSAVSPADPREYLYSPEGAFSGEAAQLLSALGIETTGRATDRTLSEFQRRGYVLAHLLECPGEGTVGVGSEALRGRFGPTLARIRRSFRPKKLVLLGAELRPFLAELQAAGMPAEIALERGNPFHLPGLRPGELAAVLTSPAEAL
jgi:hypothetical protein